MRRFVLFVVYCVIFGAFQGIQISRGASPTKSVPTTEPHTKAKDPPYRAMFIDAATEKQFGAFPYDRAFYARGIRELDKLGARAIVVAYFLDRPKSALGDAELAKSIANSKAKIIMEASLNHAEANPNPLASRFELDTPVVLKVDLIGGDGGWIPRPVFAEHAYDIGFADVTDLEHAPVLELYGDKYVKTLFTCALEAGFNDKAQIVPGRSLTIAHHKIELTSGSEIAVDMPEHRRINNFSYADLINGHLSKEQFIDCVVILGYDSPSAPTVDTKIGRMGIHRCFWYMLESCYEKVSASSLN